jgi:multidrug efflux system membrane fusion protein
MTVDHVPQGPGYGGHEGAPLEPVKKRGPGRIVAVLIGLAAIGGIGVFVRVRTTAQSNASAAASASAAADRVVPVTIAPVESKDVPIVLEGLGNVIPLATVTVKTQVDGRLDRVLYKEGQNVKKGDLLAQVDARPFEIALRNAQAQLARDKANLDNSVLNEQRYTQLAEQKLIAQQQATDQHALTAQLQAQVKQDEAAADASKLNIDYSHIISPVDGVTGVRLVDQGNIVHAADQTGIVVITQLDPIAVLFTLPEDDLPRISRQQQQQHETALKVAAYARDGVTKLGDGELLVIDNQINTTTATIRLKATFKNPDRVLWPNQFVKARMTLATKQGAIVVPQTAIQRGPQGTYVYVVTPEKTAQMRPVDVDILQGDLAILSKGVQPGEQVVTDGQNQIKPGSKVSARPPEKPAGAASASAGAPP